MPGSSVRVLLVGVACLSLIGAADIQGTIIIKHKLTKRTVTLPAGAYDRGVAVNLGADPSADPLAYERSHVIIYIDGELKARGIRAEMAQRNRRFTPDLLAVPIGSTVSFPNFDPIFHNVFSLSKPKSFDLGNYPKGQARDIVFSKPGVVLVNCHLHTNMMAAIVVTPNDWYARAGEDGQFVIRNVPPGTYDVVAWHKAAGIFRQKVIVTAAGTPNVEFMIPLDENGIPAQSMATR